MESLSRFCNSILPQKNKEKTGKNKYVKYGRKMTYFYGQEMSPPFIFYVPQVIDPCFLTPSPSQPSHPPFSFLPHCDYISSYLTPVVSNINPRDWFTSLLSPDPAP